MIKNETWTEIPITSVPFGTNILRTKIVFDDKRDAEGNLLKFKARLVAIGSGQVEGVDYTETFASVMTTKSFRILLAAPTFTMLHWDIKTALVNAPIEENVFCYLPEGYCAQGVVVKLSKALYGTKQAANAWQKLLRKIFVTLGGRMHVYIFRKDTEWLLLATYVDDIFVLYDTAFGDGFKNKILETLKTKVVVGL